MLWPGLVRRAGAISDAAPRRRPRGRVDDPQMLSLGRHPLAARVGAANAFSCLGVFNERLPIPDDPSGIEIVLRRCDVYGCR
jgi:hypothetical protein